ncbi:MAG: disulfide oxidoreductase [Bdellovibrionota bacterium]
MIWNLIFGSWLVAAVSTAGSLFFSEVMMYPPCVLCWYQRICMYPLVVILMTGLFPADKNVVRFSLPLAGVGWLIAFYHNLLYYKILPESVAPCRAGISCTTVHIEWLGFITIPFLSLVAFSIIISLLIIVRRKLSHEN